MLFKTPCTLPSFCASMQLPSHFCMCYKQMKMAVLNCRMIHTLVCIRVDAVSTGEAVSSVTLRKTQHFGGFYVYGPSKKRDGCLKYIILAFSSQQSHAYCV